MNVYLIRTSSPELYLSSDYHHVEHVQADIVEILHTEDPTKVGDLLIGAWNNTGAAVAPLNLIEYELYRPLGNLTEQPIYGEDGELIGVTRAGLATENLNVTHPAGWAQRQVGSAGTLYPEDNPPFRIQCRRKHNPTFGYYPRWEITMESGASVERNPSVRSMRVFSSSECIFPGEYLYTTGAYIYGDSEFQPGTPCWYTESNQFSQVLQDIHFATYWGETEEGRFTLAADQEEVDKLFWGHNQ